jgi:virulence-associated protein VagC
MIFFSGTEFINNRSQSDRLPVEMRFPNSVKKLNIRIVVLSRPIYYAKLLATLEDYAA